MKKITLILTVAMFMIACGSGQDQSETSSTTTPVETAALPTPESFKSGLIQSLDSYFELKDALVQTDATLAAEKALALVAAIEAVDAQGLSPEAAMLWDVAGKDAHAAALAIAEETDVEVQREHFEPLSNVFIDMVKSYGPFSNTIYVQRCPMVRGGNADWLSKEENVMNPYHGSRMMTCGSVIERI